MWHGYIGIENLGLTAPQKQTLLDGIGGLGPSDDPQPCRRNHRRVRTDNDAAIFETVFANDDLTIAAFKTRLGAIFGVDPATIAHTVSTQSYAGNTTNVLTFQRPAGTNRIRVALFGGTTASWQQSRDEAAGYLAANAAAWV